MCKIELTFHAYAQNSLVLRDNGVRTLRTPKEVWEFSEQTEVALTLDSDSTDRNAKGPDGILKTRLINVIKDCPQALPACEAQLEANLVLEE